MGRARTGGALGAGEEMRLAVGGRGALPAAFCVRVKSRRWWLVIEHERPRLPQRCPLKPDFPHFDGVGVAGRSHGEPPVPGEPGLARCRSRHLRASTAAHRLPPCTSCLGFLGETTAAIQADLGRLGRRLDLLAVHAARLWVARCTPFRTHDRQDDELRPGVWTFDAAIRR